MASLKLFTQSPPTIIRTGFKTKRTLKYAISRCCKSTGRQGVLKHRASRTQSQCSSGSLGGICAAGHPPSNTRLGGNINARPANAADWLTKTNSHPVRSAEIAPIYTQNPIHNGHDFLATDSDIDSFLLCIGKQLLYSLVAAHAGILVSTVVHPAVMRPYRVDPDITGPHSPGQ